MILSTQPITRLVLLIMIFIKSAFLFLLLDYYFLGLTYIIVYVGAIAILFLFVIMMAETHVTPLKSTSASHITILPDSLNVENTNLNNSYKLRIPSSSMLRINSINGSASHLAKGLGSTSKDVRSTNTLLTMSLWLI